MHGTRPDLLRTSAAPERGVAWRFLLLAAVALACRLTFFAFWPWLQANTGLARGSDGYNFIAKTLVEGGGYRFAPELGETMYLPPVYPFFVAGVYWIAGVSQQAVQIAQALVDTASCLLIFALGRRAFGDRAAFYGGLCYALYPGAWVACARYLTEPLFALLLLLFVAAFAAYLRRGAIGYVIAAGLAASAAILCKSASGYLPGFLLVLALLPFLWPAPWRRVLTGTVALGAMVVVGVSPWVIRNHRLVGEPVYPATSGGLALYTAHVYAANPDKSIGDMVDRAADEVRELGLAHGIKTDPRDGYPRWFYSPQDELKLDKLAKAAASERIAADMQTFVAHGAGNLWRFWIGAPSRSSMILSAALNLPLLALALVGLVRLPWRRDANLAVWLYASLYLFLIHVSLLSVVRYSLTVMPLVCLLAGAALTWRRAASSEPSASSTATPTRHADRREAAHS